MEVLTMSRTDKDNPWWVRTEWYEPIHYCGWIRRNKYEYEERVASWGKYTVPRITGHYWEYLGDCVLPDVPVRCGQRPSRKRLTNSPRCTWVADWPEDYATQTRGVRKKEYRRNEFHHPQRMKERLAAREIVKGNHEYEYPDGRSRSSVLWDMW